MGLEAVVEYYAHFRMECAQVPNFISRGSEAAAPRAGRSSLPDTGITAAPIPAPRYAPKSPPEVLPPLPLLLAGSRRELNSRPQRLDNDWFAQSAAGVLTAIVVLSRRGNLIKLACVIRRNSEVTSQHCGDDPMQGPEVQGDEANCRLASSRSLGFQLKQSERLDKQSVYVAVTIISSSSAEILRHAS
ncbi:unnamed protein product [Mesocestoides corti]|uniref:Uncharacterized protein n=1 Tax=Mesocestoides corti TaxID=53468 RepID=A0A3P6HFM4_MESCO|nr:unnamed protein product [Mesocestoides corti]